MRAVTQPGQVIGLKTRAILIRRGFRGLAVESWDLPVELARRSTYHGGSETGRPDCAMAVL